LGNIYDEALVVLHGIWRRRWLALGVAWGVGLLGWLVVSLFPNTYKSEARIYVQAASLLPDKVGMSAGEQKANIETVRQLLTSIDNLQKVVRSTDLANHVSSDAEIIAKAGVLQKAITIVAEQDNLFKISAVVAEGSMSDAQNAKLSKAVVQKLVDLFVDGNLRDGRTETGTSLKFLDAQIEQRGQQLAHGRREHHPRSGRRDGRFDSGLRRRQWREPQQPGRLTTWHKHDHHQRAHSPPLPLPPPPPPPPRVE
jgi:uncharacterized protein involved in exopolysaccharide biosynthesis